MKPPVILVVRGDDDFSSLLRSAGCEVLNLELIKTVPVCDLSDLHNVIERIDEYDGLFFTSPAAAEAFVGQAGAAQGFSGKTYALGDRAKTILENAGIRVSGSKDARTAEDLVGSFDEGEFAGKRLLFVRGDRSLRAIPQLLSGKAKVDEVIVYTTESIRPDATILSAITTRLNGGEIDWICFFSPSGVKEFLNLFSSASTRQVRTAAIGETTAREARESDLNVNYVSPRPDAGEFAAGLIEFIKNIE